MCNLIIDKIDNLFKFLPNVIILHEHREDVFFSRIRIYAENFITL